MKKNFWVSETSHISANRNAFTSALKLQLWYLYHIIFHTCTETKAEYVSVIPTSDFYISSKGNEFEPFLRMTKHL